MPAAAPHLLTPPPRTLALGGDTLHLATRLSFEVASTAIDPGLARRRVVRLCADHGLTLDEGGDGAETTGLRLVARPGAADDEGYELRVVGDGITLAASSARGWRHGVATLAQWLRLHEAAPGVALPTVIIDDRPDVRHRGVMLDISRDRVPHVATVDAWVARLADWKINQLQLYMEHTFAYPGHEVVWRHASPWTADEVRALDAACHDHGIELVPNQNSFGHFHRWLVHEPYRALAECPDGVDHPFSTRREPFSLCPTDPRGLDLLAELYDHLLPCCRSRQLNVGLDETLDLGQGRSADACARHGKGRVYLDFVRAVHGLAAARGHSIQMWGDIVLQHPDLIPELPEDIVALAWGYEADHPFADELPRFTAAGRAFYVCPGTSSWLSFGGRLTNALTNLARAARAGRDAGAAGYLVTDWGDQGHWQPRSVSASGLLAGAALAWNADAWGLATQEAPAEPSASVPMADLLDAHVFDIGGADASASGEGIGAALVTLGDLYRKTGTPSRNGSALFHLLMAPQDDLEHVRYRGLRAEGLAEAEAVARDVAGRLRASPAPDVTRRELAWVADLLALGAHLGRARLAAGATVPIEGLPTAVRQRLRTAVDTAIDEHAAVWAPDARPGGRKDSAARLAPLRTRL